MRTQCRALLCAAALALACSSHYTPRRSAFVRLTMEAGQPMVVKNGVPYSLGLFGAGLAEAVRDNPRAAEHADAHHQGIVTGLVALVAGGVAIGASPLALLVGESDRNGGPTGNQEALFGGILLGGLGLYIFGAASLAAAQPRLYDAINQYNDDLVFGVAPVDLPPTATRP